MAYWGYILRYLASVYREICVQGDHLKGNIMNLLESLLKAGGGSVVQEIGKNLGLGQGDTEKAVRGLGPALTRGLSRNAQKPGGVEAIMKALSKGGHEKYVDQPESLGNQESINDGNAILGHIFGSKDVSRNVAGQAAQTTGIDPGILKKMLPMLAAAAMGSMSKQTSGGGLLSQLTGGGGQGNQGGGLLKGFLDSDGDGDVADDLLNMAKKFF